MAERTNRVAWVLVAVLALVLLSGSGVLFVRLRPYWIAKYRGQKANLQGAYLAGAALPKVDLTAADLTHANLSRANLFGAILYVTDLRRADLRGANLESSFLRRANLAGADLRGANLKYANIAHSPNPRAGLPPPNLQGAIYNSHTRWPSGFDPHRHGAVRVE